MGPPHRVSLGPQRVPAVQSSVRDHSRPPHSTPAPAPPPPHRPRFCRLRAGSGDCAAMVRPLHVGPAVDPVAARHAHLPLAGPALAHRRAQLGGRRRRLGGGGGLGAGWGRALLVPAQGEVAPRRCARVRGRQALRHRIQRALRAADLVRKLVCGGGGRGPALWSRQLAPLSLLPFPRPLARALHDPPRQASPTCLSSPSRAPSASSSEPTSARRTSSTRSSAQTPPRLCFGGRTRGLTFGATCRRRATRSSSGLFSRCSASSARCASCGSASRVSSSCCCAGAAECGRSTLPPSPRGCPGAPPPLAPSRNLPRRSTSASTTASCGRTCENM